MKQIRKSTLPLERPDGLPWEMLHARLRTFIARRVDDEADVEDILQDVYLRMYQHLATLKDPHRFLGWIFRIVRNGIIDYYRSRGTRRDFPSGLGGELEMNNETVVQMAIESPHLGKEVRKEMAECIRPMIARLPRNYREALVLVELEGLSQGTAAQKMGVTLSGMKSRVQRGRKQLKDMLNACCKIQLDQRNRVVGFSSRTIGCVDCESP